MRYHRHSCIFSIRMAALCLCVGLGGGGGLVGCGPQDGADLPGEADVQSLRRGARARVERAFAERRWIDAIAACQLALLRSPDDCEARYCELLGRSMVFVDQLNNYVLPRMRAQRAGDLVDVVQLLVIDRQLADMATAADAAATRRCSYDLPLLPLRIGDAADPLVLGEVRGRHTPRGAYLLGALANAFRYTLGALLKAPVVPAPPVGELVPGLPTLLLQAQAQLAQHDALLFSRSVAPNPALPEGGWYDKDRSGAPSLGDELLIDIFRPGGSERVFDLSGAQFVRRDVLPRGALTPTRSLPAARCGYQRWHIDTVLSGAGVGTTDGLGFLQDGRVVVPIMVDGRYQIHAVDLASGARACLTCAPGSGSNDGVRVRPGGADALIFVSSRDHPFAIGGAGGGAGQELYAMRTDGTQVTRLTFSDAWATNYHVNFSADGRQVVWGRTQDRTWDVMVADFVDDAGGLRLERARALRRDTTWWETHDFSADGQQVIVSNSRAGLLASDLYAMSVKSGELVRLTAGAAWEEHAHLSPGGRKLLFMSGRSRPASVLRLNDGSLSPIYDFLWIVPGVFFEFINPPAGYATELYLMDADGRDVRPLTQDGQVVADSVWSADARRVLFRQSEPALFGAATVRLLTFDDCR